MKFTSIEAKKQEYYLQVGDVFQGDKDSKFLVVQPLVKKSYENYKGEGYTYVNLTNNRLIYPKVFDSLGELQDYLESNNKKLIVFDGGKVEMNLGEPVYLKGNVYGE